MPGFKNPHRRDVTSNSGGLLVCVNEHIKGTKELLAGKDTQAIPIELNIRKRKRLILTLYRRPRQDEAYSIEQRQRISYFYAKSTQKLLVIGAY